MAATSNCCKRMYSAPAMDCAAGPKSVRIVAKAPLGVELHAENCVIRSVFMRVCNMPSAGMQALAFAPTMRA